MSDDGSHRIGSLHACFAPSLVGFAVRTDHRGLLHFGTFGARRDTRDSSAEVNLTDAKQAQQQCAWSDPARIQVDEKGLGWGAAADEGSRDFWLQTIKPIALGESWRPPISANVRVTIDHVGTAGILYVRHSPDAKNWSEWQVVPAETPTKGQSFQGEIRVPYREQGAYRELLQAYSRREDVPWASDEEAFVKELVAKDADYFQRQKPFIGYVQFLYETQLHGGQRIAGIKAEVSWAIGGVHAVPKNPDVYKDRGGPWRFKAE